MKYGIDNSYDRKKKLALIKMLRRNNGTMWLGQRSIDTTNGYRTTGGVLSFIDSANVYDVNENLTQAEFEYWMRKYALAYNNTKKTLFCGSKLIERINSWASSKQIITSTSSVVNFGLSVKTYTTAWGDLDIVYEPYFDELTAGTSSLSSYGVALDLDYIKFVYLQNGVLKGWQTRDDHGAVGRVYRPMKDVVVVRDGAGHAAEALGALGVDLVVAARALGFFGIPLEEQKLLAGVAVDAVFDSVSVATTFREKLAEVQAWLAEHPPS